ncbi:tail fiber protein [Pseudomonas phage phiIBB-PF7A]|uniref:Tail fiber protein n=1 Tax=Pseudomonas phage phiIBB-PF7A TaxID=942165 RepID=E9KIH4_9CAUD|nr:tail fiber protein [Pseudomonas phage phiIBB-PF7A]ADV35699.1 tail fiber protein [Pseudomonas phage phiIBB-PF7A]
MADAPKTTITYPLDGSNKDFPIPFEYLARKFVQVTLVGTDRKPLILNIDFRFTQRTIITTTKTWGPSDGYNLIEIRRYTSATERLVDFSDGSILRAYDLNTSQVQSLHIAEEGRDIATDTIGVNNDGDLDARGRKIVNVADGTGDFDAVNLRQQKVWAGSALNQADRSKAEADRSTQQADRSTQQANASAQSAVNSETSNKASFAQADRSKNEADRATVQATEATRQAGLATTNGQAQLGLAQAEVRKATEQVSLATTQANRSQQEADRATAQANASAGSATASKGSADAAAGSATASAASAKTSKENADKVLAGFASFGSMPLGSLVQMPVFNPTFNQSMRDQGFLPCNGEPFDAVVYADLAKVLGAANAPDLLGKYTKCSPDGSNVGQTLPGSMPSHAHTIPEHGHAASSAVAGWHAHAASAWTDAQGQHSHTIQSFNSGGVVGNSGYVATAGKAQMQYQVGGVDAAGAHAHNVGVSVAAEGNHSHTIYIGNQVAFSTTAAGTGPTVEVDRFMVFTWIKAKAPAGAAQLNTLLDRIAALEAKL